MTGGAGIGKSTLLEDAAASAPADVTVLRATGAQAERELRYGGLSALCRPLRELLDELPAASRTALALAHALDAGAEDEPAPHAVGAGLFELLVAAAERAPVLVLVDDHHWLDAPSRRALAFSVRRLAADRVCVLLAHGTGLETSGSGDLPALPHLALGGLEDLEARRVLRDLVPTIAAPVADAVVATACGSPGALTAVSHALTAAQLAGQEPLPDPLPTTWQADALDDVSPTFGLALAVAAAEPAGDLALIRRALCLLDVEPAALDEAEGRRILSLAEGRVVFGSPMLRSFVYHRIDRAQHRRVHRALADVLPPEDVERRAWHLAECTVERNDEVAALLVEAGRRAAARGAPQQAAASFQRAGRLSEDFHQRTCALLAAAQQAVAAGHVEQARALAEEVVRTSDDVHARGEACIVLARMTSLVGDPTTAFHAVHELVDAVVDSTDLAARLCIEAVGLAFKAATAQAIPCGLRAVELAGSSNDGRLLVRARLALAVARSLHGEQSPPGGLLGLVQQALDDDVPVVDIAVLLTEASIGLHATGRGDEGLALIDLVARAARTARAVGVLPQVLLARADLETSLNRYNDSWSTTAEAGELVERLGQHAVRRDLAFRLAGLQGMRGNHDEARAHYAEVLSHGSRDFLWLRARRGLGVLELGVGRPEAAVNSLEQLDVLARTLGRPDLSFGIYEHDLALGYLQVGRRADAEELTGRFAGLVASSNHATAEAALAYMRGLLAADEDVDPLFARAVELARPTPFLHVRALSAWAEALVRRKQVAEATGKVHAAREIAEAIGAPGLVQWVDRAAAALPAEAAEQQTSGAVAEAPSPHVSPERLRRAGDATGPKTTEERRDLTLLCVLGRWELRVAGAVVTGPAGVPGKALRLLALRGQVHVEELTELLWPDSDPQSGRMRLRNVVSRIRASVGPIVERRGELVALSSGVKVDVDRFEELARAAHAAAEAGDAQTATEIGERALALHLGPLLPDSPYADWALVPRERARRLHVGLLDLLASTAFQRGDVDAALALLERAIEEEPYEEERYLHAAEICLGAGRRGAATALLERAKGVAVKLGVPTDPRQVELGARLRRGPAAAAGE